MLYSDVRDIAKDRAAGWWLFLLAGVGWLIIAAVVLKLDLTSVATVGVLLGVIFLVTAVEQFVIAAFRSGGWAFLRLLVGVFFLGGAIWAFIHPYTAFWSLAAVLGILLLINGFFNIVYAGLAQPVNSLWWLGLITGVLEIALGIWASSQIIADRALLLLLWIGFYAIFRGITDIVLAFELSAARR